MTSDHAATQDENAHHGPTTSTYLIVAVVLVLITAIEVKIYYVPSIANSAAFVPILLVLSAIKFFTVVAFYMHLKYDHKLFRTLFGGPFVIILCTIIAFLFLFGQLGGHLAK